MTLDDEAPRSHGPTGRAFRTGRRVVVNDFAASPMTAPWHERLATFGFASSAAFPIEERDEVVAVLTVYAGSVGFCTDELVETLSELTPSLSPSAGMQGPPSAASRIVGVRALLVEDDVSVRAVVEDLLVAAGCDLVLVASSDSALELARDDEPFDLLVTDIVMPKINGVELARAIRSHRPGLPVLFVSGYPQGKFVEAVTFPNSVYLPKPFTRDALRDILLKLLPEHVGA